MSDLMLLLRELDNLQKRCSTRVSVLLKRVLVLLKPGNNHTKKMVMSCGKDVGIMKCIKNGCDE